MKVLGMGALALALSAGAPGLTIMAHAQQQQGTRDGATSAAMHNAAYDEGLANSFTSAETIGEMLECSAIWQRWSGVVESSGDPAFRAGLRKELSAANANTRHRYWQRQARRDMREDSDVSYFDKMRGQADSWADGKLADYAAGSDKGFTSMMNWLATC